MAVFSDNNIGVACMKNRFKVSSLSASDRCKCVFTDYSLKSPTFNLNFSVHEGCYF